MDKHMHYDEADLQGIGYFAKKNGVNFNDLPPWQKRGVGLWWETYKKEGRNPLTGETTRTSRRRIHAELDLPVGDRYGDLVHQLIEAIN